MSTALIIFLISFLLLLLLGTPVAWAMGLSSLFWMILKGQLGFLAVIPERIYQGMDSFTLLAIPLFILAGEIVNEGKITEKLIHFANIVFGWMKGGLAQVNIGASILFSGITGVALGDIAALGNIFIPSMAKQGYTTAYAAAVTAASSIIGPMVPPSLVVIIYGSMTDVSIGALFIACILPGILIGLVQMLLVAYQARKYDFKKVEMDRSPKAVAIGTGEAIIPLMIPVIIILGIVFGIMTPTEAGAAAAFYALIVSVFLYRTINPKKLYSIFQKSMSFTGQLVIIVGCGALFSWIMAMENVPLILSRILSEAHLSRFAILIIFNLFLLVLGMFIDPSAAIILFAPILSSAAKLVGIDPVHFGTLMILNLNIGLLTPPLGVCLFAAEKIAKCGFNALLKATLPFLGVNLVALALVSFIPEISLFLPRLFGF